MNWVIELNGVAKRLGKFHLGPVDLKIKGGDLLALCGHNGSGKTTLVKLVTGMLEPDTGTVIVAGEQVRPRSRLHLGVVGYVPDETDAFFPELTARENIELVARLRDRDSAASVSRGLEVLGRLGLSGDPQPARGFSHGMKKKLMVALAVMHEPSVLIVDELRNGLDPVAAVEVEEILDEARADGVAVLAATHDIDWVLNYSSQMAVLSRGHLGYLGDPRALGDTARDVTRAVSRAGLL